MAPAQIFGFNDIFRNEISVINARRAQQDPPREKIILEERPPDSSAEPVLYPSEDAKVVGLALSGGGVRSAAFCLGALQALDEARVLDRVDYLSTVSGGGYIGCSLSAGLEATEGKFPFKSRIVEDETPSTQHIRDHSNYLFPNGAVDVLRNASIYVRGLVANFLLIMPFLLLGAALTIFSYEAPSEPNLTNIFGFPVPNVFGFEYFVITAYLSLILLAVTIGWGLVRSARRFQSRSEVPSGSTTFVGTIVVVILLSAFCELQPLVLDAMFFSQEGGFFAAVAKSFNTVSAALAPVAAAIGFFGQKLAEFVKSGKESSQIGAQIAGYAAKAAIYLAALAVPLLLWVIYLNMSYWGICIADSSPDCPAPAWLSKSAKYLFSSQPVAYFYLLVAAAFFILTLFLRPNANSLHPLYRDRLGKAFLFTPQDTLQKDQELEPQPMRLSGLSGMHGPYHLINTALNIQNSKTANKRGRNADFFLLSQSFIGSETTGYAATKDVEKIATGLNLATAMAVSGAAASSSMGSQSIKPLTPTLALLNIRLGYWLRNPLRVGQGGSRNIWANFYFLLELFGLLNEHRKSVYLTDGGHIENLGLYELFKRCCRVIIVVDAEADPEMAFGSFNTLVRYARIDLGLEIELPWQQISNINRATGEAIDKEGDSPKKNGPHCAVGEVTYPDGRKGILVYIKSSLTGDENDYVFHYRKRYSQFPHETTIDQMFSEEQFEAYRALGYHAANGLFDRRDRFAHLDPTEYPQTRAHLALLDELFPRLTAGGPPRQHRHFVAWLPKGKPPAATTSAAASTPHAARPPVAASASP